MPENSKIFAIGDVHGCREELETLLQRLQPQPNDQFIFLGDLINRGPDPLGVIRLVRTLPNTTCLFGNHELRLLRYRQDSDPSILKPYDWDTIHQLTDSDWIYLSGFLKTLELPELDIVLVHGGFIPWLPWQDQNAETVTNIQAINPETRQWGRRSDIPKATSWQDHWKGPPYVICGHTPRRDVYRAKHSICIDTGCTYGGQLTALEIRSGKLTQVSARQDYVSKSLSM